MTHPRPYRSTVDSEYSWECLECGHIGLALIRIIEVTVTRLEQCIDGEDYPVAVLEQQQCPPECAECGSTNLSDDLEPPEHDGEPLPSFSERNREVVPRG